MKKIGSKRKGMQIKKKVYAKRDYYRIEALRKKGRTSQTIWENTEGLLVRSQKKRRVRPEKKRRGKNGRATEKPKD